MPTMKRLGCAAAAVILISLLAPVHGSQAAGTRVQVTLPDFKVKLNGNEVVNRYREYPLLVYKDITYFPMTWNDSRLLGLEALWSEEQGLTIHQAGVTSSYEPYRTETRNSSTYTADIQASAVTINGKSIDNASEVYPLLTFRDVTYFPLTWRFAHDEFGWDYRWDDGEGLSIESHNPQLQAADLPAYAGENAVAKYKGYYYFVETDGTVNHVYRASEENPSEKEEVYSYDIDSAYGLQKWASFQIREDALWFTYHHGGATMGYDNYVKIGDDGKGILQHQGYLNFKSTPFGTLITSLAVPPSANNLYLSPQGEEPKPVGKAGIMYGRHVSVDAYSTGVGGGGEAAVVGDHAYILGTVPYTDLNKIYDINLKTKETVKVSDTQVAWFRIIGDTLYYVKDSDHALYASSMDGSGERKLSDYPVAWFEEVDGRVFYTTMTEKGGTYMLYQAAPEAEDPPVLQFPLKKVLVQDGKLVCLPGEDQPYGMELLDSSGRLLLAVADPVTEVLTSDQGILFKTSKDTAVRYIR